jgi:hypothetical protein
LLALKGDLDDRNQGVYADVITMPDTANFRVYVGSAAGIPKSRKDSGLSRRIKEHIVSMKKGSRPESGVLHAKELGKVGAQPHFIILVRFSGEVDVPIVRIAEALMVVLFETWDNQVFRSLRPANLTRIPRHIGLNNANPLTGGFIVLGDLAHPEDTAKHDEYMARCRSMGKRMSAQNMAKILKNAREGGSVTVTRRLAAKTGVSQYGFKALGQHIFIPSGLARDFGLDSTRKINVVYDISQEKPHHTPFACKTRYDHPSRLLGIKLKGHYGRGPMKGDEFQKWLQCGSSRVALTAKHIMDLIQQTADEAV